MTCVGCSQHSSDRESVRCDCHVEVFKPFADSLQICFDRTETPAHVVCPFCSLKRTKQFLAPMFERRSPVGAWESLESIANFGNYGMGKVDLAGR